MSEGLKREYLDKIAIMRHHEYIYDKNTPIKNLTSKDTFEEIYSEYRNLYWLCYVKPDQLKLAIITKTLVREINNKYSDNLISPMLELFSDVFLEATKNNKLDLTAIDYSQYTIKENDEFNS